MSEALILVEYKHDFTARPSNEEVELVPSIGRVMQTASNRDKRILFENYHRAKKQINEWMQINQGLNHSKYIQNIALKYLRRLILEDNSNWAQDETKHLLGILIQLKSVDLDVLADAFTKVQHRLSQAEKETYLNHIVSKYHEDMQYVKDNWQKYQDRYQNSKVAEEQTFALLESKHLEWRSQACKYTKQVLGLRGI